MRTRSSQTGFTLMEVVVATTIFATVLTLMLVLFDYTLKINRRVEALRQVTQATRNFTEFLVREVRNGSIDYSGSIDPHCSISYSNGSDSTFLAIVNRLGDRECFYLQTDGSGNGSLWVHKISASGAASTEQVSPSSVTLNPSLFHFYVRPLLDPQVKLGITYPGVQPFVTIIMQLTVRLNGLDQPAVIPYQTTVSTDSYNIPHR